MRGSGKTTNGKILSENLGWKFIDIDHVVEENLGKSIKRFVSEEGSWEEFRKIELEALQKTLEKYPKNTVVSTGLFKKSDLNSDKKKRWGNS